MIWILSISTKYDFNICLTKLNIKLQMKWYHILNYAYVL